jgi:Ni,Fe-hydrogenase III small subunit
MRKTLFDSLIHRPFTERLALAADPDLARMATALDAGARRRLGRSLAIRTVDAGSCNACELELNALSNPFYDLERFGLRIVASPRHADVLLVTGPVTRNMGEALLRTYEAMPGPKWVVAVGDCAICGGLFAESGGCLGGAAAVVPVDLRIPGCPPTPTQILAGLIALMEP